MVAKQLHKTSPSVKVVVRCRPLNHRERALGSNTVLSMDLHRGQCFISRPGARDEPPKQFTFDGTYFMDQPTERMYNEIAYPLVEGVTEGYNGTIFAYGQTGSGKSFTMQGVSDPAAQRGVIPRAFEHIFESIQCAENTKFLVRASYLEIYNEEIRDLLGSDTKQRLEVRLSCCFNKQNNRQHSETSQTRSSAFCRARSLLNSFIRLLLWQRNLCAAYVAQTMRCKLPRLRDFLKVKTFARVFFFCVCDGWMLS
uniref:Kinesin motor domain-containing protein n=1 Tax=Cyclopterus lumpus TaxID=8103 RepID=A0A8C2WH90_CYCLU